MSMSDEKKNLTPEERRKEAAKGYCRFMQTHNETECRNELLRIWRETGFALNAQDIAEGMNDER